MWTRAGAIIAGAADPPFTIVHRRTLALPGGHFTPAAEVSIGPGSAASGLFAALGPHDLQTLLAVVSLVTTNGWVRPTCHQVAAALGVTRVHAFVRLMRLTKRTWRGKPVIVRVGPWGGMVVYIPSSEIVAQRLGPLEPLTPEPDRTVRAAGREAVIEASRKSYARPRADVERELAEAHGWPFSEEAEVYAEFMREGEPALAGEDRQARQRLARLGVDQRTAERLVREYGRDRVVRQIAYLPHRKAKDKAKLLVSSIESDYAPPPL